MTARIYRPARTAMQSGKAKTREWVFEYEAKTARVPDPLMGWTSAAETTGQVRLTFETLDAALAHADRIGVTATVTTPHEPNRVLRSYSDNFDYRRRQAWTH
jgi:hypothetical protein